MSTKLLAVLSAQLEYLTTLIAEERGYRDEAKAFNKEIATQRDYIMRELADEARREMRRYPRDPR